jgi:hypothetical protein
MVVSVVAGGRRNGGKYGGENMWYGLEEFSMPSSSICLNRRVRTQVGLHHSVCRLMKKETMAFWCCDV